MLRILLAATLLLFAAPATAKDADDAMAPIKAFIGGINSGDMKAAAAAHVDAPSIIDEFAPHHWTGNGAFSAWLADFGKDAQANGVTGGMLKMRKPHRLQIDGDSAYVVVPTDYSYKRKGKPVIEHGTITYALTRTSTGWRIAAWTYSW